MKMKKSNPFVRFFLTAIVMPIVVFAATIAALSYTATEPKGAEIKTIVLSKDNTLSLGEEVNEASVGVVINSARSLDTAMRSTFRDSLTKKPLYLFLNTPGGSVQDGLELIEALQGLGRKVHTVTLFAASMGFQIAQNLNDRYIFKNGTLMSHRASGQVTGQFGGQSPSQLVNRLAFWTNRIEEMDVQTVKRTKGKQTLETYQKSYANEMWRTGTESVSEGYADEIVNVRCDESLSGVTSRQASFLGMPLTYDIDDCPIHVAPKNVRLSLETSQGIKTYDDFIAQGGKFGPACLMTFGNTLCALDTSLNTQKMEEMKNKFVESIQNTQRNYTPMRW